MLRIVEERETNNSTKLRVDGRLVGQWVGLLLSNCEQVFERDSHVILDLSGVSFADHDGVLLLQSLEERQVTLINCSPFLQELLKQSGNNKTAG